VGTSHTVNNRCRRKDNSLQEVWLESGEGTGGAGGREVDWNTIYKKCWERDRIVQTVNRKFWEGKGAGSGRGLPVLPKMARNNALRRGVNSTYILDMLYA
jgi:hypothetical protein